MIDCRKCKLDKPSEEFRRDARYKRGFTSWCRDCHREANRNSQAKNRVERSHKARAWRMENIEKARAISRNYSYRNKEDRAAEYADWAKRNKEKRNASTAKRKAAKLQATPAWVDWFKVQEIYANARRLQDVTGVKMHVDHIIPLQGENVCGLHWEGNLQILTAYENVAKHNRMPDEANRQPDMFVMQAAPAPEQTSLL